MGKESSPRKKTTHHPTFPSTRQLRAKRPQSTSESASTTSRPRSGNPTTPAWKHFESQVAELFRLRGFTETHDSRFAGRQTDLLLKNSQEFVGTILVECKYHDPDSGARVGVVEVEDFVARTLRLRNSGDITFGYLVTNTTFTQD